MIVLNRAAVDINQQGLREKERDAVDIYKTSSGQAMPSQKVFDLRLC
jgi:hypothetical protein